jgi:hypothetical protein
VKFKKEGSDDYRDNQRWINLKLDCDNKKFSQAKRNTRIEESKKAPHFFRIIMPRAVLRSCVCEALASLCYCVIKFSNFPKYLHM